MQEPQTCTFEDVVAAQEQVYKHLNKTPLLEYAGLSELLNAQVFVKHENHHAVGSFKVRGGVNLAARISSSGEKTSLYTASTGNHGQSIAFAGKVTGLTVHVALPEGANRLKAAAIQRLGAKLIMHGLDFDEAREWMCEQAIKDDARFIGPTDPELIAGVGTYTLEILEQLPDVDAIIVPVGAGSGASSVALVAKTIKPKIQVIAVQAKKAPAIYDSWNARKPVAASMETSAEGLATRVAFENTLQMMCDEKTGIDDFLLVSEKEMEEAAVLLLEHTHNLAELAGAASLAAAIQLKDRFSGKKIALVLSGGNMMASKLKRIIP